MKGLPSVTVVTAVLALGIANPAQALWSPEPTDIDSLRGTPTTGQPSLPAESDKILGYTPPLDVRNIKSGSGEQEYDPLFRRLAAGQVQDAIEIPFVGAKEAAGLETFTRVSPAVVGKERGATGTGNPSDVPIPAPSSYWLLLWALPVLFLAHLGKRMRTG